MDFVLHVFQGSVGDALEEHFFGPEKKKRLTVDKFRIFHARLIDEVMRLEVSITYTCR